MEEFFKVLNEARNTKKIYIIFIIIGLSFVFKTIKKIIDEIKRK